jgi:hypothetical protein
MENRRSKVEEVFQKRKKIKLKKYRFKDAGIEINRVGLYRQTIEENSGTNESKSYQLLRQITFTWMLITLVKYCALLIYYHNQEYNFIDEKMFCCYGDFFFF